jgi:hypothetical protein
MNKYISILLLLAVITADAQDLPWAGTYTGSNVANYNDESDVSQCCVPIRLIIIQDESEPGLLSIDIDFGSGSHQCDPSLNGTISIQQEVTWGRVIVDDPSMADLDGSWIVYLLNNNTILFKTPSGCEIKFENANVSPNSTNLNYTEVFSSIWVVSSFWMSDPNQESCCLVLQPVPSAYDAVTNTSSRVDAYPDDPACPDEVRNTFTLLNMTVSTGGSVFESFTVMYMSNGSIVYYQKPPFCNVIYTTKQPTISTSLCDFVDQSIFGNGNVTNATNENESNEGEGA